jgi:hypothetical protein
MSRLSGVTICCLPDRPVGRISGAAHKSRKTAKAGMTLFANHCLTSERIVVDQPVQRRFAAALTAFPACFFRLDQVR